MPLKQDLKQLLQPFYLLNTIFSLSYIVLKRMPGVCNYLFHTTECEFDGKDSQILFFLLIVVMIRTRKAGSVTMLNYLSSSFVYAKSANLLLWFSTDVSYGILFGIIIILSAFLMPQPTYSGPNSVIYFRGSSGLEEELQRVKDCTWLVAFYTAWSPHCITFAPTFDVLSQKYHLDNLKFGKMDVGRYPEAGKQYHVSDSGLSKQLPTIIMFSGGKEVLRRPTVDSKSKLINFTFTSENIVTAFDLNNLYKTQKEAPKSKKTKSD